jgi:uncharacterized membrane protein YgcG
MDDDLAMAVRIIMVAASVLAIIAAAILAIIAAAILAIIATVITAVFAAIIPAVIATTAVITPATAITVCLGYRGENEAGSRRCSHESGQGFDQGHRRYGPFWIVSTLYRCANWTQGANTGF